MADPFVHLHVHSDYSLLDGACQVTSLVERAAAQAMPAVALTDHGNLYGAVAFYEAARARGIRPIIGCELYVCKNADHRAEGKDDTYHHLVVLCENQQGYRNLVKIVSEASLHGFYYKPRISKKFLAEHSQGLIGLSACLKGEVQEYLLEDQPEAALLAAAEYQDIFGKGGFYLEIQDQGLDQEKRILPAQAELARRAGLPLVATNDCHYLDHADAASHEVLLCVQTGKRMSDSQRMRFSTDQFYFKSAEEMRRVFAEFEPALRRTLEIAERCQLEIAPVDDPFPHFEVPAGHTLNSYLEHLARAGLEARAARIAARRQQGKACPPFEQYRERLARELAVIQKMNYAGYFLIVWDFIRYARENGIAVGPGRGSAAGSLASYALGITDLDPLEHGLLFERFLNSERISMPDIDVDFCMERRGEVIEYVTRKYGRDNVCQIITFGTLGAKAAIKDVGRALDMPYAEVDRLAKLVPNQLNITLEQALAQEPSLRGLVEQDGRVKELLDHARRLEGQARHAGMHAAGVVIAPRPLTEWVPLARTARQEIVTQYDLNGLEKLGLLKMDFLGLTTLTILQEAQRLIEARGQSVDWDAVSEEDPAAYEVFCRGLTSGIFQFESNGMRDILRRYRPDKLSDLTALNALYRPGPIQGGMIDDFIDRKHGRKKIEYDLPGLKPILAETLGVFLYQEQVMRAAHELAGYSLGEADLLRRAMGKKKPEEMARQRETFIAGATARGLPRDRVARVFDLMEQFAGYGFNKSHAAAYAVIAFRSAWLKAHYPLEFMAALLTLQMGNTDNVALYIQECRAMQIAVLPPDINVSDARFTPSAGAIRFGLEAIKNLGANAVRAILEERARGGAFSDLPDLCRRVGGLNRRVLESLVKGGAMDAWGTRAALCDELDGALEQAQKHLRDQAQGQHGLFLQFEAAQPAAVKARKPEWDALTKLQHEKDMLGMYVSAHPLDGYDDLLLELEADRLDQLREVRGEREHVRLAGVIAGLQIKRNKRGENWAVARLESREGSIELLCFAEPFRRYGELLRASIPVLARGRWLADSEGAARLQLEELSELAREQAQPPRAMILRVDLDRLEPEPARALPEILSRKPGPTRLHLYLRSEREHFEQILELQNPITADAAFRRAIRHCGALRKVD